MKRGFKTTITQAADGNVVARVGCKLFVGAPADLKGLAAYYGGELPRGFKRLMGGMEPWMGGGPEPCGCQSAVPLRCHELSWGKSVAAVTMADNGYVVRMGDVDVVFKAGTDVARALDEVFEGLVLFGASGRPECCDGTTGPTGTTGAVEAEGSGGDPGAVSGEMGEI